VTNTSASTCSYQEGEWQEGLQTQYEMPEEGDLLEASCLQRSLFVTPEGIQGIFVALPTADDQPVPFLFVQVHDVKTAPRKRFGSSRSAQVNFRFSSVDVGGLDGDFIQQNVYNDPEAAWRQLQDLESGYGGGGDGHAEGYEGAEGYAEGYAEGAEGYAEGAARTVWLSSPCTSTRSATDETVLRARPIPPSPRRAQGTRKLLICASDR